MFSMRLATVCFVALMSSGAVLAQRPGPEFRRPLRCEPLEPRTKLETLEGDYERVLIKGFTQVATMRLRGTDVRIDAVELKDSGTAVRATGLVIAMRETSGERPSENRSFLDYEEIDSFLRAMDFSAKVNETVTKLAGFEARYRTRGDFELVVFRQGRASGTAASVSTGICDRVTGLLTLDELELLRAHIVEAKARLDEIK
ncbi:MAG TPA: hypothetical protein VJV03_16945 [Pyrinomonadaceae bacterium]|nr:hypothetical protein [Pyrinomonadaceae bacterium]